jgi:putative transposase
MTRKAYKYRIYPTKEQEEFFAKTFGSCRFVWNKMLSEKLYYYENKQPIPRITPAKYKDEFSFLKEIDSLALANIQLQLEKAFKSHMKNKKHFGLPKFKKKKDKQSYTTNIVGNNIKVDFENGLLYIPKIKEGVKAEFHRTFIGKIKSVTISKTKGGRYYASILVEVEDPRNKVVEPKSRSCGIDLGLESYATITNDFGTKKIEHPKYYRKAESRLKKLQRKLSRKQKGSNNYEKARIRLAKYHEYISNLRNDFLHKLSKAIIDENQVVVVEDLNVKGMQKSNLAKSIFDSGWSKFLGYLEYKANWYGRKFHKENRFFPSSKQCHYCGYKNKDLVLKDRYWTCPSCGKTHDRDVNASINLYLVGLERPEFTPVESLKGLVEAGSSTLYRVE